MSLELIPYTTQCALLTDLGKKLKLFLWFDAACDLALVHEKALEST